MATNWEDYQGAPRKAEDVQRGWRLSTSNGFATVTDFTTSDKGITFYLDSGRRSFRRWGAEVFVTPASIRQTKEARRNVRRKAMKDLGLKVKGI